MPSTILDNLDIKKRTAGWERILEDSTQAIFVAVASGAVVGFVNSGPERERDPLHTGEIYALYLLASAQKRGYGKALFLRAVRELLEKGHISMLLWVLSTNPARGFYERMGGKVLKTKVLELADQPLEEIAYGYADLPALSSRYSSARA